MMPPVRWYVERKMWKAWDPRLDEWVDRSSTAKPVLQYWEQESGKWVDVPTWYQEEWLP